MPTITMSLIKTAPGQYSPPNVLTLSCERGLMAARLSAPTRSHNESPAATRLVERGLLRHRKRRPEPRPPHQPMSGGPPPARELPPPAPPCRVARRAPVRRCRPPRRRSHVDRSKGPATCRASPRGGPTRRCGPAPRLLRGGSTPRRSRAPAARMSTPANGGRIPSRTREHARERRRTTGKRA